MSFLGIEYRPQNKNVKGKNKNKTGVAGLTHSSVGTLNVAADRGGSTNSTVAEVRTKEPEKESVAPKTGYEPIKDGYRYVSFHDWDEKSKEVMDDREAFFEKANPKAIEFINEYLPGLIQYCRDNSVYFDSQTQILEIASIVAVLDVEKATKESGGQLDPKAMEQVVRGRFAKTRELMKMNLATYKNEHSNVLLGRMKNHAGRHLGIYIDTYYTNGVPFTVEEETDLVKPFKVEAVRRSNLNKEYKKGNTPDTGFSGIKANYYMFSETYKMVEEKYKTVRSKFYERFDIQSIKLINKYLPTLEQYCKDNRVFSITDVGQITEMASIVAVIEIEQAAKNNGGHLDTEAMEQIIRKGFRRMRDMVDNNIIPNKDRFENSIIDLNIIKSQAGEHLGIYIDPYYEKGVPYYKQ